MKRRRYREAEPFITKDGSTIRELVHPAHGGSGDQSLAEASVPVGMLTALHCHHRSAEIYHIIAGRGMMTLGNERFEVEAGDSVDIPPGTPHAIENIGEQALRLLCCCAPAYRHDDTQLL